MEFSFLGNNLDSLSQWGELMQKTLSNYKKTGTKEWNSRIAIKDLAYQVGCIIKLDMQLHGERYLHKGSKKKVLSNLEIELAEVIALAIFVGNELNLDVKRGFKNMLKSDQKKVAARAKLKR